MIAKPKLIVCGSVAVDHIMGFAGEYKNLINPDKLDVLSVSVLLDSLTDSRGGSGANIAYNSALLGDAPILFDSVGQDAANYMQDLQKVGVNTDFAHYSKLPTASFSVFTDSHNNQIGGFYPGAMGDSADLSLKRWAGQEAVVVIAAHDPASMLSQTQECQQYGFKLVYDPGQQVSNVSGDDMLAGINAAEVLIVNDYEMSIICQKTKLTEAEITAVVPIVITTYGKNGSTVADKNAKSLIRIAAAKPKQVIDPTGAGDGYRAGFLYGYLRQWSLTKCGQLGSVVASFVVESRATQVNYCVADIQKRYKETFNEEVIF